MGGKGKDSKGKDSKGKSGKGGNKGYWEEVQPRDEDGDWKKGKDRQDDGDYGRGGRDRDSKGKRGGKGSDHGGGGDEGNWSSSSKPLSSSAQAFQPSGMFGDYGYWAMQYSVQQPPLWQEFKDKEGTPYYYNSRTGLTQWEKPQELEEPKVKAAEAPKSDDKDARRDDRPRGGGGRDGDKDDSRRGKGDREKGDRDRGGDGNKGKGDRGGKGKKKGEGRQDKGGGNKGDGKDPGDFGPPGCNLFVFHLPDDWTDDDLNEYFAPHGNVVSAKVMKELGTGRSRGFGFVSYEDRVSAATAVKKMQGYKILGKRLKVEFKKGETDGKDDLPDLPEDEDGPGRKNYPDDERLIGYLRAISAKNVVQSLKESENAPKDGDDNPLDDGPPAEADAGAPDDS